MARTQVEETKQQDKWLVRASDAYTASTSFVDNNYRRTWENNIRHFHGKHASGSKYYTAPYQYRSRLFRPKTRSMVRSNEAAAAAAFFTNSDAVDIDARNTKNPNQRFSAELRDGLLNHHLDETIPWYEILCGGMQDGQVQGVICSKQHWKLRHEYYEEGGKNYKIVREDEPCVDIYPIENLRISPNAKWYDPVKTSPFVILMQPMYIEDVKELIRIGEFKQVDESAWHQALVKAEDTTRQVRQNGKQDQAEIEHTEALKTYDQVWVHENFMRVNGKEVTYYTLGTIARLTDPAPLSDVYWHNVRPIALGRVMIETHTPLAAGPVEISAPLQKETNEVTNTRQDNIKFVLNKRYIVGRGKQVDLKSLVRNAPGSITMANNVDEDVRVLEFQDVTGSSFAEHDRLSLEFDELVGNFSGSSVQSNRKMNETVGGMAMIRGASNQLTQYLIDVFAFTWVREVLKQLDMLVQEYESDIELMQEIAETGDLFNKYGVQQITPQLLKQRCRVVVNVANSATDPMVRLEQFLLAVQKYNEIVQSAPMDMDLGEVRKEIFGRLGYRDGSRFFVDPDSDVPIVVDQLQQQVAQLTQVIEQKQVEEGAKTERAIELERVKGQLARELEAMKQSSENVRQTRELDTKRQIEGNKLFVQTRTDKQVAKLSSDTQLAIARMRQNDEKRKQLTDQKGEQANMRIQGQIEALFTRIDEMERTEIEELSGGGNTKNDAEILKAINELKAGEKQAPQEIHVHMPGMSKKIDIRKNDGGYSAEVGPGDG